MNAFTVDLEEWFCSHNLAERLPIEQWPALESRVERSTFRLLELLDRAGVKATFFVLGWVAERYPDLVKSVAAAGHEIGSHGYAHRPVTWLTPAEFEADTRRSLDALAAVGVSSVAGFRAPAFSVTRRTLWAVDILQKLGFQYDASVYPIGIHPDYGIHDAPLEPFRHANGLLEIPLSVAEIGALRLPCGGGGYLRQLPYPLFKRLTKRCLEQGRALNFYIHPWEIDPGFPRLDLPFLKKWRHYRNLESVETKIRRLLDDFDWGKVEIKRSKADAGNLMAHAFKTL